MIMNTSQAATNGRRAELTAELFFQELSASFVAKPTTDVGFDLLVGFQNNKGGINTYAVEVKATEQSVPSRFPIATKSYKYLAHSNIPAILLVVDVKQNRLYYAWLTPEIGNERVETHTVRVPITEISDDVKKEMRERVSNQL